MVHNLGDVASAVTGVGARATSAIPYDGSVAFRLVLTDSADYVLWCRYTGEDVTLDYSGPAGVADVAPGPAGSTSSFHLELEAGQYTLTAKSDGNAPASVDWDLHLAGGVGQAPAAAPRLVRLVTPASPGSQPAPSPPVANAQPSAPVGHQFSSSSPSPGYSGGSIARELIQHRPLLGHPSADPDHVEVVGPSATGSVALAGRSDGLTPGTIPTVPAEDSPAPSLVGALFGDRDEFGVEGDKHTLEAADWALALMIAGPTENPPQAWESALDELVRASPVLPTTATKGSEEGVDSDRAYAALMLPSAGMAFYCIRIRTKAEARGRSLSSRGPASRWRH